MFCERLKEERKRLSFSQTDFGTSCGVTKQAQIRYEKGVRSPDSDYLEQAHKIGVDVSYLITGKRTQPVELPSDESLLLDSYRVLDNGNKKMALAFLIGGIEHLKNEQNDDGADSAVGSPNSNNTDSAVGSPNSNNTDSTVGSPNSNNTDSTIGSPNSNNTGSAINSPNSNNENSVINSPNSNNIDTVINSPYSNNHNSFNNESGFTELTFIYACAFCGAMAWLLGALASWKAATDMAVSLSFGQVGLVLWAMTIVMAIFGHSMGKKKFDKVQKELGN